MSYLNGRHCRQTSPTQSANSDPILIQIARDTGETRSDIRHLLSQQAATDQRLSGHEQRLVRLERRSIVAPGDVLPWIAGCALLILTALGKANPEALASLVQR